MIRVLASIFVLLPALLIAQTIAEPQNYRMEQYRAPVPDTLSGGTVLMPQEAYVLWEKGVAFIDVLPQAPKPENLPEGTLWRDKPRHSIPGALWLPNVGYGALAEETEHYFKRGLEKATDGKPNAPVVIFCLEECWMSWNAAKRAIEWGYSSIYWLPDGTDGWQFYDYPLELVKPEAP